MSDEQVQDLLGFLGGVELSRIGWLFANGEEE